MKRHNQIIFTTALSLLFTLTTVDTSSLPGAVALRVINRRRLVGCPDPNPYLEIHVSSDQRLPDQGFVEVNVTGVVFPSEHDWMAMISPSDSDVKTCVENKLKYEETGDSSHLPLLCHYPVKAQNLTSDPYYLNCTNKECKKQLAGKCLVRTCSATLRFHVVNIRTDIEFVLFGGGFDTPCILKRSDPLSFANPNSPLYGHLSLPDSTGTKMSITWVSGDNKSQQVHYGNRYSTATALSNVSTFSRDDMCKGEYIKSPAFDFGWHNPGYIHTATMTGLSPSTSYSYVYGSDLVGWSENITFKTPPFAGANELKFIAYGDMGKAPLDASIEHFMQPGSVSVVKAMADDVSFGLVDSIFHIGDISYATGFLVEWDYFLSLISTLASRVPYMTSIGNHERNYMDSASLYKTTDSGGECGVPYETYFPMPTPGKDRPWYSIEQGSVHFMVISTEHNWSVNSEQYEWMRNDMAAVDRTKTPWIIFTGHRPMYTTNERYTGLHNVDHKFIDAVEPLLLQNKVDLALFGHIHNYERTCAVYQKMCLSMPTKEGNGIDTYDNTNYSAPVHAIIGMAGFTLDEFPTDRNYNWSLSRIAQFGYIRAHATRNELKVEFVNADTKEVGDSFRIIKN